MRIKNIRLAHQAVGGDQIIDVVLVTDESGNIFVNGGFARLSTRYGQPATEETLTEVLDMNHMALSYDSALMRAVDDLNTRIKEMEQQRDALLKTTNE